MEKTKLIILLIGIILATPLIAVEKENTIEKEKLEFNNIVIVDVYRPTQARQTHIYHHESHNVITNVGLHTIQNLISGQGTTQWSIASGGNDYYYLVDEPNDIALSIDETGADAIHSCWQNVDGSYPSNIEIIDGGLARQSATRTLATDYTAGSGEDKGSITFTFSAVFVVEAGYSFTGVQKAGLFAGPYNENNGLSGGSDERISPLVAENTFDPIDLNAGDSISITWTITI